MHVQISPSPAALGHAIRVLRARQRLSQEEVGFRGDLHRNYVGAIERAEGNPTYSTLLRLSTGLETPLSALIALAEQLDAEGA